MNSFLKKGKEREKVDNNKEDSLPSSFHDEEDSDSREGWRVVGRDDDTCVLHAPPNTNHTSGKMKT